MTNRKRSSLRIIQDIEDEPCRHTHESVMCDNIMGILSRLDIGYDKLVRYHMANELYILLKYGPIALAKHRSNNSWWG
jgi:hypothetical protein